MPVHAQWVHGNAVRPEFVHDNLINVPAIYWNGNTDNIPWSNVNGLPRGWGTTYRGKRAFTGSLGASVTGPYDPDMPFRYSQKGYWFHIPIPTPVIIGNVRSRILKVFTLYGTTRGVALAAVHLYDGPIRIGTFAASTATPTQPPPHNGINGHNDLIEGVTMFTLPAPREVLWGIGISIGFFFMEDGEVTFTTAGADFEV